WFEWSTSRRLDRDAVRVLEAPRAPAGPGDEDEIPRRPRSVSCEPSAHAVSLQPLVGGRDPVVFEEGDQVIVGQPPEHLRREPTGAIGAPRIDGEIPLLRPAYEGRGRTIATAPALR